MKKIQQVMENNQIAIPLDKLEDLSVNIFVGLKNRDTKHTYSELDVYKICEGFCDKKGLCVSITSTNFIYTKGNEPGVIIGLINYPRFPSTEEEIYNTALDLSSQLLIRLEQYRISFNFKGMTYMLTNPNKI
jgi:hypothetical protein